MFDVTMAHAATAATGATDAGLGGLVLEKAGQYVLIIAFFGSIIWFLRFLYGPRGIFRDPAWDRWNDEARRDDARREAEPAERDDSAEARPDASAPVSPKGERR